MKRRHSTAFEKFTDADLKQYRRMLLPRELGGEGATLEKVVAWAKKKGVTISIAAAQRDGAFFAKIEDQKLKFKNSGDVARELLEQAAGKDQIAGIQSAANAKVSQLTLDLLLNLPGLELADAKKIADLGGMIARLQTAELSAYRERVADAARRAARKATDIAGKTKGDVKAQLNELASEILGVGK